MVADENGLLGAEPLDGSWSDPDLEFDPHMVTAINRTVKCCHVTVMCNNFLQLQDDWRWPSVEEDDCQTSVAVGSSVINSEEAHFQDLPPTAAPIKKKNIRSTKTGRPRSPSASPERGKTAKEEARFISEGESAEDDAVVHELAGLSLHAVTWRSAHRSCSHAEETGDCVQQSLPLDGDEELTFAWPGENLEFSPGPLGPHLRVEDPGENGENSSALLQAQFQPFQSAPANELEAVEIAQQGEKGEKGEPGEPREQESILLSAVRSVVAAVNLPTGEPDDLLEDALEPPADLHAPKPVTKNTADDHALHAALLQTRKEIAKRTQCLPFHVYANTSIKEIVKAKPTSLEQLEMVPGVGAERAKRYGQDILSTVRNVVGAARSFADNHRENALAGSEATGTGANSFNLPTGEPDDLPDVAFEIVIDSSTTNDSDSGGDLVAKGAAVSGSESAVGRAIRSADDSSDDTAPASETATATGLKRQRAEESDDSTDDESSHDDKDAKSAPKKAKALELQKKGEGELGQQDFRAAVATLKEALALDPENRTVEKEEADAAKMAKAWDL
eukprot:SAG31_NODE_64_length_28590_cov_17.914464_1_plen_560_part_10